MNQCDDRSIDSIVGLIGTISIIMDDDDDDFYSSFFFSSRDMKYENNVRRVPYILDNSCK